MYAYLLKEKKKPQIEDILLNMNPDNMGVPVKGIG
jgi:hypothetical protein